jgi:hypothetical protein
VTVGCSAVIRIQFGRGAKGLFSINNMAEQGKKFLMTHYKNQPSGNTMKPSCLALGYPNNIFLLFYGAMKLNPHLHPHLTRPTEISCIKSVL